MNEVEQRRERRRTRIIRDITSLRATGDGEAVFLRALRIPAVAERLAFSMTDDFTLIDLERQLKLLFLQFPSLRVSPDELRSQARGSTLPNADDLRKLTAEQRLAIGNERARLKRLEAQRAKDDCDGN